VIPAVIAPQTGFSPAVAFLLAAVIALVLGGKMIALLAAARARQPVSGDAPAAHQAKQGTPTMGGLLIIAAAAAATLAAAALAPLRASAPAGEWVRLGAVLATFVLAGGVGLLDDLGKARKKENKAGLSERAKLALQVIVAALFLLALGRTEQPGVTTAVQFGAGRVVDLDLAYYVLGVLYLCFFGNAVNFTDGLDGLATGVTAIAALALAATVGLFTPSVSLFYGAVAGACVGFLWFNAYPARVFMGDTGSLALGMGMAAAALAAKQEVLLLLVGAVYLAEIGSMMLQRYVFKWRRVRRGIEYAKAHRVFRRAPLHHHFEELGWPETRVVARFWIFGLLAAALGILAAPHLMSLVNSGGAGWGRLGAGR
jgi:phospho-N-acetylmuramoyl-pentapeptide-transferase